MQHLKLLWKNSGDGATLSGGNWTLPIAKVQTQDINDVARSNGLASANSSFIIDFGTQYTLFRGLALVNINCSVSATIRILTGNDNTFASFDYDTGTIDIFNSNLTTADVAWESGNWWWGRITETDLAGYVRNYFVDLGSRENRYIKIIINDPNNAYGYVDIGRLLVGTLTQYTFNYAYGAKLGWIDPSIKSRSIGGKPFADVRQKYRTASFSLDWLSDAEAMTVAFELERSLGTTGEIFIVPDSDDAQNLFRRSFLAQLSELSGLEKHLYGYQKTAYKFEEIL